MPARGRSIANAYYMSPEWKNVAVVICLERNLETPLARLRKIVRCLPHRSRAEIEPESAYAVEELEDFTEPLKERAFFGFVFGERGDSV